MDRREFLRKAAAVGLTPITPALSRVLASPIQPAEVRGHVVSGKKPLKGVRVSDGYRVVKTDASGEFHLTVGPESGPFLFVTTPQGFWTDQFYVPTATASQKRPLFQLKPINNTSEYRALYITDIHLGDGNSDQSFKRFRATIEEINRLDPLPAFCWMGGDISLQRGKGREYVELISRLKMPVRNSVGNHEMMYTQENPRGDFQQLFGPTYYSFDVGQVHYVTLEGCRVDRLENGYKNVVGLLSARELNWLEHDLKNVPDGTTTVVAVHIPLVSDYPERRDTTSEKAPYWVIQNADRVIELLSKHNVSLVLQGHLHENNRMFAKGIEFVESNSICGTWWKSSEGMRENGVSGEPRGYRMLEVRNARVEHRYLSSAESQVDAIGEIVGRPETLPAGENASLQVNIFDGCDRTKVLSSLDDGPFNQLQSSISHLHYANLKPAHHWQWSLQGKALTPGKHLLKVRVEEPGHSTATFQHHITV